MVDGVHQNGIVHDLPPPTDKPLVIKDKFSLVLEIIWAVIQLPLHILYLIYRIIFPPPGKSLNGQVALVTGAGRGLGQGLALRLAKEGCKVAVVDLNQKNAEETVAEITNLGGTAKAYFTNVAKVDEVKNLRVAVTKDLGPVDILVNNAGLIYFGHTLENNSEEIINAIINVNLVSHFWTLKEFLPSMKERNFGHIVAIASVTSFIGDTGGAPYVASKFGVRGMMDVLRKELRAQKNNNVKTTTVYPYFINTSAQYVDHWDLRFPPITIEEAVEETISAVKRNEESISIPGFHYFFLNLFWLIPIRLRDMLQEIVSAKCEPLSKEESVHNPTTNIAREMAKK